MSRGRPPFAAAALRRAMNHPTMPPPPESGPPRRWRSLWIGVAAAFLAAGTAAAQLTETSPFLQTADSALAGRSPVQARLELRGIMKSPAAVQFCIYDPARKISVWSELKESGYGFVITSADLARDSVIVQVGGQTLTLVLHQAQVTVGRPTDFSAGPTASAEGTAPSAADQARQMQDAAEAVRLRRVQREQAALKHAATLSESPASPGPH